MKKAPYYILLLLAGLFFLPASRSLAQTGVSVSPPRTYFTLNPGEKEIKTIRVSNPSPQHTLELSVSLNDWSYNLEGENVVTEAGENPTSMASWINILPQSFFSLAPGESHDIELEVRVPGQAAPEVPVHTSMLYITQINPIDGVNERGESIKVAVRSGVKIYQRYKVTELAALEVNDFAYLKGEQAALMLNFSNKGNTWTDGTIHLELFNQQTGEKTLLEDLVFYTLPGDERLVHFLLPENLTPAKYIATAILDFRGAQALQLAELSFTLSAAAESNPD